MRLGAFLTSMLAVAWAAPAVGGQVFVKGPYLQNVSSSSITLLWQAAEPGTATVRLIGVMPPRELTVESDEDGLYEVVLQGLATGRHYRYAVECSGMKREGEFATAPGPDAPFTFIVFGDTRSNARSHENLITRVASEVPDFILGTGDMVDEGGSERQWQEFFDIEGSLLAENVLFPSLGNHDRQGPGRTADNFRKYFALPDNSPDPERYYAFTYAGARVIVLDSNAYSFALTDQTAWLEAELRATQLDPAIQHVFISMHHPAFSISLHGGQRELRERWAPLFEQYDVTAVFSGHDHVYSRADRAGVRYFVSGGGGAPLYPRSRRPSRSDVEATRYFERVNHYLRVHVTGEYVEVSAIRGDGSLIETVSWRSPAASKKKAERLLVTNTRQGPAAGSGVAPDQDALPDHGPRARKPGEGSQRSGVFGALGAILVILAGAVLVVTLRR